MLNLVNENAEYKIKEIMNRWVNDGVLQYYYKFKNQDKMYNEFVDVDDLDIEKLI